MKKITTFLGAAALLAATLVPAFAAGNNCGNSTTGPFSNNTCTVNNSSNVTVNNVNDAQIVNNVRTVSSTGGNSASYNTLGGAISTGNASSNVTVSSVANVNTTNVTAGFAGGSNSGMNEITGPYSDNSAYINNDYRVNTYNSNTATVNNSVNSTADSGNNNADYNTGPASVRTGNTALGLSVANHVNDSFTAVSLGGSGSTNNNTVGNSTTGPFSTNDAVVNNTADVNINNVNDLRVDNRVLTDSNSGKNSASYNTLGGEILTGNATSNVGVNTEGNINTTAVSMALGSFTNDGSNDVTGPYSNNSSYVNNARNVLIDNWNNKCRSHNADDRFGNNRDCDVNDLGIINDVNDSVDAGNNNGDYNTGGGIVTAGWSSLVESVLSHLNDVLNQVQI